MAILYLIWNETRLFVVRIAEVIELRLNCMRVFVAIQWNWLKSGLNVSLSVSHYDY